MQSSEALRRQVGAEIARRRAERDWSQAILAQKAGLDVGTISRMERGVKGSDHSRVLVAEALGVEVHELFTQSAVTETVS